jgi:hypothetical protein
VPPAVITEGFAAGNDCSCRNVCVGLPAQTDVIEDVEAPRRQPWTDQSVSA